MSEMSEAAAALSAEMADLSADPVLYVRGDSQVAINAVHAPRAYAVADISGDAPQAYQSDDWLIQSADLVLDGQAVRPAAGDKIIATEDGATATYVLAAEGGLNCWNWSGPGRYRVRTKLIASEEES